MGVNSVVAKNLFFNRWCSFTRLNEKTLLNLNSPWSALTLWAVFLSRNHLQSRFLACVYRCFKAAKIFSTQFPSHTTRSLFSIGERERLELLQWIRSALKSNCFYISLLNFSRSKAFDGSEWEKERKVNVKSEKRIYLLEWSIKQFPLYIHTNNKRPSMW